VSLLRACAGRAAFHNQVQPQFAHLEPDDSLTWGRSARLGPGRRSPIEHASILASKTPLAVAAQPLPQANVRSPFQQFKDLIVVRPATGPISRVRTKEHGCTISAAVARDKWRTAAGRRDPRTPGSSLPMRSQVSLAANVGDINARVAERLASQETPEARNLFVPVLRQRRIREPANS